MEITSEILKRVNCQDLRANINVPVVQLQHEVWQTLEVTNVTWACSARTLQGFGIEKEERLFVSQVSIALFFCDLQVG